ncbi:hypothetical protein K474DRAFT_1686211 [Panus rudis PR-1116 ss-1]|nr:hypothetical protein K474DRAFT_1686211 [Panus rudis PR-1116 ss-1]
MDEILAREHLALRAPELAKHASTPLTFVGYIFTDLTPQKDEKTKLVYTRHPQSFFLSSLEVIFAAHAQNANSTPSKSSSTGQFASRMVTAVSEQACAMVDADMIEASVDPNMVRVKEEDRDADSARYNEYGLEVKKSAKPCFPVEYLLVNVSHGFPQEPSPLFRSIQFPIESRQGLEDQHIEKLLRALAQLNAPDIRESAQGGNAQQRAELAKFLRGYEAPASHCIYAQSGRPYHPRPRTGSWQTLMTFTRETAPPPRPQSSFPATDSRHSDDIPPKVFDQIAAGEDQCRVCPHCTFVNSHGGSDCEVYGLPLNG